MKNWLLAGLLLLALPTAAKATCPTANYFSGQFHTGCLDFTDLNNAFAASASNLAAAVATLQAEIGTGAALPLVGGTMNGSINLSGFPIAFGQIATAPSAPVTGVQIYSDNANVENFVFPTGGTGGVRLTQSTAPGAPSSGGTFYVDSANVLHYLSSGGALNVGSGTSFGGNTDITLTPSETGQSGASGALMLNKVNSTHDTDDPLFHSFVSVDHSGGSHIFFNSETDTVVNAGANPTAGVWSVLDKLSTNSSNAAGGMVAHYNQALRDTNGGSVGAPLWASVQEARSVTGLPSSQDGIIQPVEIDLFANGVDDMTPAYGRTVLTLALGKDLTGGANVQATAAINITADPAGSNTASYKSTIINSVPFSQAFLDNRLGTQMSGANSLWLATGQTIGFDTAGAGSAAAVSLSSNGTVLTASQSTSAPSILALASPLNTGPVGKLSFMGQDASGAPADYADLIGSVVANTHGATVGQLNLNAQTQISTNLAGSVNAAGINAIVTAVGSGTNGPTTAQDGAQISLTKNGWNAGTAAVGEIDGLNIFVRQGGAASDAGGLLVNVQNTGTGFLAMDEMVSSIVNGSSAITQEIDAQDGVLNMPGSQYFGKVLTAVTGALTSAIHVQNQGSATWGDVLENSKGGVSNFVLNDAGAITVSSGLATQGNVAATGTVTFGNSSGQLGSDATNGNISLGKVSTSGTPHFDWFGEGQSTYNARLISDGVGQLSFHGVNGAAGVFNMAAGVLAAVGHVTAFAFAAPTLSGCGTSPSINATATDTKGTVTEGTTATGCVITWNTAYGSAPDCVVSSPNGAAFTGYTPSTTTLTIVNASASGDKFSYVCVQ